MYGTNPIRKIDQGTDGLTLLVQGDPWVTIQGEGPYAGLPATFIRLWGCHLHCTFCFVGQTNITMGDGRKRKIKDIRSGDMVLAYNERQGQFRPARVTTVMQREAKELVRVVTGKGGNPTDKVFCTPEHPFLVRGKGWVTAANLQVGDTLIHLSSAEHKRLFNPMKRPEVAAKVAAVMNLPGRKKLARRRMTRTWRENPLLRGKVVARMASLLNPMKDPLTAAKAFLSRVPTGMTTAERRFEKIIEGLPVQFVGDGRHPVGNKFPDFLVQGQKKLIEVWARTALHAARRGTNWRQKRAGLFARHGYKTLFVPMPDSGLRNGTYARIRQCVAEFVHNGAIVSAVEQVPQGNSKAWIALAGAASGTVPVFNLDVEGLHTYVANGKVVHNCDTDFESHQVVYETQELARITKEFRQELVVLTGGEPLRQNIGPLIGALRANQHSVQIETAGNVWQPGLEPHLGFITIVVSPKTPTVHPKLLGYVSAYKYIISAANYKTDPTDGLPVGNTQGPGYAHKLARPTPLVHLHDIYLQPMDEGDPGRNKDNLDLCVHLAQKHGYRLSLQQHKIIGVQ